MPRIEVASTRREEFIDITGPVEAALRKAGGSRGWCLLTSPHTTAGLTVNEGADPDVAADILSFLGRLVPRSAGFRHAEGNSDAHVKTSLMGVSLLLPVRDGRLVLGTWQRVFLCEFDGPRHRTVQLTLSEKGGT